MRGRVGQIAVTILASLAVVPLLLVGEASSREPAPGGSPPAPPPVREIPGITTADVFPGACVDCHVVYPEINLDARLSTHLKRWNEGVEPAFLARVQAYAPAGVTLAGKHPEVAASDIPASCLECHGRAASGAPPFARMLHGIHLTGGESNHFLTLFQGECTHCHKLDPATGGWRLPSGGER